MRSVYAIPILLHDVYSLVIALTALDHLALTCLGSLPIVTFFDRL